jgi:hypothetical protein
MVFAVGHDGGLILQSEARLCECGITDIKIAPDIDLVVIGNERGTIMFHNLKTMQLLRSMSLSIPLLASAMSNDISIDCVIDNATQELSIIAIDVGYRLLQDDKYFYIKVQTLRDAILYYCCIIIDDVIHPTQMDIEPATPSQIADVVWHRPSCFYSWSTSGNSIQKVNACWPYPNAGSFYHCSY